MARVLETTRSVFEPRRTATRVTLETHFSNRKKNASPRTRAANANRFSTRLLFLIIRRSVPAGGFPGMDSRVPTRFGALSRDAGRTYVCRRTRVELCRGCHSTREGISVASVFRQKRCAQCCARFLRRISAGFGFTEDDFSSKSLGPLQDMPEKKPRSGSAHASADYEPLIYVWRQGSCCEARLFLSQHTVRSCRYRRSVLEVGRNFQTHRDCKLHFRADRVRVPNAPLRLSSTTGSVNSLASQDDVLVTPVAMMPLSFTRLHCERLSFFDRGWPPN